MTQQQRTLHAKSIILLRRKRWLYLMVLMTVAMAALAFGYYVKKDSKASRVIARPAAWGMPTALPDHIILTVADNPATTQTVTWRTDTTVKGAVAQIALADAAPRFWKNARAQKAQTQTLNAAGISEAEIVAQYHSVTFSGLLPDTTYAYRVGDGSHWSEWFQFRTAAKEASPFSFIFMGDVQNNILENYAPVVRQAVKTAPDAKLMLYAGDIINFAHSEKQWHEWFSAGGWLPATITQVPVVGNHEYGGYTEEEHKARNRKLSVQWQPQFTLPQNGPKGLEETAYYFDYQGVRFIALNSNEKLPEQAQWLKSILQNNSSQWTVVAFHHPVFSAAHHSDNKTLRTLWQPIFEQYGVDLVLTGHEHTYTRGQALKNGKAGGPVYVVSVSGGKMYGFEENTWSQYQAQLQRKGENTQLFQVVTVDGSQLQFKTYAATGAVYDAFTLIKDPVSKSTVLQESKEVKLPERNHRNTIAYLD